MNMSSENHSYRIAIAIAFAIPITCIAVFLRLLARRAQRLALGADDYVIILGAVFTIGHAVVNLLASRSATGRHRATLEPTTFVKILIDNYVDQQLYGLSVTCIRLSILLFYRRIFTTTGFRRWTNFFGALVLIWLILHTFCFIFLCSPVRKAWQFMIAGHCVNPYHLGIAFLATNISLDIMILALPVSEVWRLQLSRAKKISVASVFLLGGLSIIPCFIRLMTLVKVDVRDITWKTSIYIWAVLEPALQVLSVCLPSMAPFLHGRGRKFRTYVRTLTRSALSRTRNSMSGSRPNFHNMDRSGEYSMPENYQRTSMAATDNDFSATTPIPLQSIMTHEGLNPR